MKKHSLFVRLFLIFMALGIALIISLVLSFHFLGNRYLNPTAGKNIHLYAQYLKAELGSPPTLEAAKQLALKTDINIGVRSNGMSFFTGGDFPDISKTRVVRSFENMSFRMRKSNKYFVLDEGDRLYVFAPSTRFNKELPVLPLVTSVFLFLFFIAIAYHMIRKLFKPLEHIKEAASHYARGDFNYDFPAKGKGQLGELSKSIKEMAKQIEQMLASKRELLLAMAHELKTPLARMKLHLEFIGGGSHRENLNLDVDEMNHLIENILESERLKESYGVLRKEPVDLAALIQNLLLKYPQVELKLNATPKVEIDRLRYELAIKNLLTNALKYGQGKPIQIVVEADHWWIMDQGDGVSENELEKIIEAFYRVDKSRERATGGTGLGLFLVSRILKAHEHSFILESSSGQGFKASIIFKKSYK